MSIFTRQTHGEREIAEAMLTPAVTAMIVDGEIGEQEVDDLANMVRFSPVFDGLPAREVMGLATAIFRDLREHGPAEVNRRAAERLGPRLSETAYSFASRVVYADRHIAASEEQALAALRDALGIDAATGAMINEVMAIMHRSLHR